MMIPTRKQLVAQGVLCYFGTDNMTLHRVGLVEKPDEQGHQLWSVPEDGHESPLKRVDPVDREDLRSIGVFLFDDPDEPVSAVNKLPLLIDSPTTA